MMDQSNQLSEQIQLIDDEVNLLDDFVDCFDGNALKSLIEECESFGTSSILINDDVNFGCETHMPTNDVLDLDQRIEEITKTTTDLMPDELDEIDLMHSQIDNNWDQFESMWSTEETVTTEPSKFTGINYYDVDKLYEEIRRKFKLSNFDELKQFDFSMVECDEKDQDQQVNQNSFMVLMPINENNLDETAIETFCETLRHNAKIINQFLRRNRYCAEHDDASTIVFPFSPTMQVKAAPNLEEKLKLIDEMQVEVPIIKKQMKRGRKSRGNQQRNGDGRSNQYQVRRKSQRIKHSRRTKTKH